MIRNRNLSLCFYSIAIFFIAETVGHEAIINGEKAEVDQFPYQISLQLADGTQFCGGGIIHKQFIISAAHCFLRDDGNFEDRTIHVIAGTNDFHNRGKSAVTAEIEKIFVLKKYKPTSWFFEADIAIAKLRHPLQLSEHIKKLELPKDKDETFFDKTAVIAGFGRQWVVEKKGQTEHGGNYDSHLRFGEVEIRKTMTVFGPLKMDVPKNFINGQMKQDDHSKPRGICKGDSGGPLVLGDTVIGVASISGPACSEIKKGAIYTSVAHYLYFIKYVLEGKPDHKDILTYTPHHKTN